MFFLFFCLFFIYSVIGVCTVPMLTRAKYKELCLNGFSEAGARVDAPKQVWAKTIIWPVAVASYIGMKPIIVEAETARKKELERKEVERILKEEADRDPVNQAFKKLEEEEAAKEVKAKLDKINEGIANMPKRLNLPESFHYSQGGLINQHHTGYYEEEEIEVRNFDGSIAIRYSQIEPVSTKEADRLIEEARQEIKTLNANIHKAKNQVIAHQITPKHYENILYQN